MKAKTAVFGLLSEQKKQGRNAPSAIQAEKEEWVAALNELFKLLLNWLKDAIDQQLLEVQPLGLTLKDDRLGAYETMELKILTPSGVAIHIVPKSHRAVGTTGRVDFECLAKRIWLVRQDRGQDKGKWQFAEPAPSGQGWFFEDLSEDSFWRTLNMLLS